MSRNSIEKQISNKVKMPAWKWISENCNGMTLPQVAQSLQEACSNEINVHRHTVYNIMRKAIQGGKITEEGMGIVKGRIGRPRKISDIESLPHIESLAKNETSTASAISTQTTTAKETVPTDKCSGPFKVCSICKSCNEVFAVSMTPCPGSDYDILLGIKSSKCPKCGQLGTLICKFTVNDIPVIKTIVDDEGWVDEDGKKHCIQTEEFVDGNLNPIPNPFVVQ